MTNKATRRPSIVGTAGSCSVDSSQLSSAFFGRLGCDLRTDNGFGSFQISATCIKIQCCFPVAASSGTRFGCHQAGTGSRCSTS